MITIDQSRFESYRRRPEFIQRYIFPGGMLPTTEILEQLVAKAGLRLVSTEFFGDSYARTLAEWHRRFLEAWPSISALGFDRSLQADVGILSGLLPARLRNRRPECRALQDRTTIMAVRVQAQRSLAGIPSARWPTAFSGNFIPCRATPAV